MKFEAYHGIMIANVIVTMRLRAEAAGIDLSINLARKPAKEARRVARF